MTARKKPVPPPAALEPAEATAAVGAALAPISLASPITLADAEELRTMVAAIVGPAYQVEAYFPRGDMIVEVRQNHTIIARREIPCVG